MAFVAPIIMTPADASLLFQLKGPPMKSIKYTIDIKINATRDILIERLRALIHGQKFPTCVKKGIKISGVDITTAPMKSIKYTIDIKINATRDVVIERLRALIHGQKFPTCVKKGIKISGVDITTAPLKTFKYTIDIKINASRDVVIERLRALIHGQKFPTCVKKGIKISGVNITTAPMKSFKYTLDIKITATTDVVIERLRALIHGQNFPTCVKKGIEISGVDITTAPLKSFKYTIDIKINASRDVVIERLRALIHGQKFPQCVKKGIKISDVDITTAPLKSFKYSIGIKINASRDVVVERLRALIHGQKFPTCVKKGIKISGVDITTAPLKSFKYTIDMKINASRDVVIERLRALIHGQKFPTCVKKGIKISGVNITTAPLKSFKYTINIKINASRDVVVELLRALIHGQKFPTCVKKGIKISGVDITTVCLSDVNQTQCKCENQSIYHNKTTSYNRANNKSNSASNVIITSTNNNGGTNNNTGTNYNGSTNNNNTGTDNNDGANNNNTGTKNNDGTNNNNTGINNNGGTNNTGTSNNIKNSNNTEFNNNAETSNNTEFNNAETNNNDKNNNNTEFNNNAKNSNNTEFNNNVKTSNNTEFNNAETNNNDKNNNNTEFNNNAKNSNNTEFNNNAKTSNNTEFNNAETNNNDKNNNNTEFINNTKNSNNTEFNNNAETSNNTEFNNAETNNNAKNSNNTEFNNAETNNNAKNNNNTEFNNNAKNSNNTEFNNNAETSNNTEFNNNAKNSNNTEFNNNAKTSNNTEFNNAESNNNAKNSNNTEFNNAETNNNAKNNNNTEFNNNAKNSNNTEFNNNAETSNNTEFNNNTKTSNNTEFNNAETNNTKKTNNMENNNNAKNSNHTKLNLTETNNTKNTNNAETNNKAKNINRKMSLAIDETYDANLNNQNSEKFKKYKADIENAINKSYNNVEGFYSATVTGFRPGSVIVDFLITSSVEIKTDERISQAISDNMKALNFSVDLLSVAKTDNIDMRKRDAVFPEQNMTLSCPYISHFGIIDWRFQGKKIQPRNLYIFSPDYLNLTVKSVTIANNGRYECLYNTSTGPQIFWDRIDYIKPYPSMQVPSSKTYKCENGTVKLDCCVHSDYSVHWEQRTKNNKINTLTCITQEFNITAESSCAITIIYTCKLDKKELYGFSYSSKDVKLDVSKPTLQTPNSPVTCYNDIYGFGEVGAKVIGDCGKEHVGFRKGECRSDGSWVTIKDTCVLRIIDQLQQESQGLDAETLTNFVDKVNNATKDNKGAIVQSEATVSAMVEILNNIADVTVMLDKVVITNFLSIVDVISSDTAKPVWEQLNSNGESQGNSSQLLSAIESVLKATSDTNFNITSPTNSFLFKKVTTSKDFSEVLKLNSTAVINISGIASSNKSVTVTVVAFSSLGNVMPARNRTDGLKTTENVINGLIVVVNTSIPINNIQLNFEKLRNSVTLNNNSINLLNPQCVFWEFNLFNRTGGWDSTGCEVTQEKGSVTCHCNHTTSFSILMSPFAPDDLALSVITYVGVAISIGSLVVCLIIEIIIWKEVSRNSTSHVRHVSLVNIALSLLIADICFIIGAAIVKPGTDYTNSCSTAVFFTHFFYLSLFFWMLVSAVLLLYRTTMVFSQMSKSVMMALAFIVGYGAPLLISVITVASTAGNKHYLTQNEACWLNWDQSKALLAFVLPALVIVAVNMITVIIVVVKMIRRGMGESNRDEKNTLVVILRCVAILTPVFGITWGLGLGIMIEPKALAIHYLFAIFNSLQGFFILVLGTLMEKKVRETLKRKLRITRLIGSHSTHTSSSGARSYGRSSSSNRTTFTDVFNTLMRRGRHAGANSSHTSGASDSFLNA
ncbi:adhesion G protein-coupled receptor F5-like [Carassius carassius]|uniref:adhesion G protein-coupled receptor F5-like n=1 Tax=Carassius carassius TaxID=217509 RepID=UPI00286879F2|nr:adhesion G protein-coupled receptor F5-like [Carassius carassius]